MVKFMNNKKLYDLREYNDLYQKEIAEIIGVSQQTYSIWENGSKIIPLKHLNKLCNYYDASMDYVLGLSENNNTNNLKKIKVLNKKNVGNRVREIRDENNLTLRDLAEELKTTSSTVSAYETGKTLILTAFAYQICFKNNISLDWLCGRSEVKELK